MEKVLFVATYGDFFSSFQISNMKLWQSLGCEVHCVANFKEFRYNRFTDKIDEIGVKRHHLGFYRTPFNFENIVLYQRLKELMQNQKIDIIDCHNPVVSILARLAANSCSIKKIVYTVHGFFFYKGCSLKNKLIFKPIEFFMARYTDALIVTNLEDYESAKKMKVRGMVYYVPGVGVDLDSIRLLNIDFKEKRAELNVPEDAFVLLSVGECIKRKNHETAIRAFAQINNSKFFYIIIGDGELLGYLKALVEKLNVSDRVIFLGYRTDANEILKIADLYIFPSFQEGLSVALMQAMVSGLPIVATGIRGNVDCIDDRKGGILTHPTDFEEMKNALIELYNSPEDRKLYGQYNYRKIEAFSNEVVLNKSKAIFNQILN